MTDQAHDHDPLHESAGLYVLGALDPVARAEFERHLATCERCASEVRALAGTALALTASVPLIDPPPSLRRRVLASIEDEGSSRARVISMPPAKAARTFSLGWLSAAAMLLVAAGTASYAWSLRGQVASLRGELREAVARLDRSEQQLTVATRAVSAAEARMAVITAPDLRQVNLQGQPVSPAASGRAFLSRSRGVIFTATNLPPLRPGRSYQLWVVTATAPVSVGLLDADSAGRVVQAFDTPPATENAVAVAVTEEPAGGLPAPTGEKYLVGVTQ